MSYAEQWTLINSDVFRGRLSMALMNAAIQIESEASSTGNYAERRVLALEVQKDPTRLVSLFMYAVASNPQIAAAGPTASVDGDIDYVVASNWTLKAVNFTP